ncbi:prepilin-type N-terminal cleavage/methylation domain-containing protein [Rhizobium sp. YIM 134829]|uniref:prepilin-type N-terminal cleavage/methylation domain-containing protein n=1 Tax=Rhizobium sp. YIM 134829 TaxID=3390453 RepID=UPI00397E202B
MPTNIPCPATSRPIPCPRSGQTALPEGAVPMPTSSSTSAPGPAQGHPSVAARRVRSAPNAGFSMIEVVLGLVIFGLLASLGLPFLRARSGDAALRSTATEIVAVMRAERNAALRTGTASSVVVDPARGVLRTSSSTLRLAPGMTVQSEPQERSRFLFTPDGKVTGGVLVVRSNNRQVRILVESQTAIVTAGSVGNVAF